MICPNCDSEEFEECLGYITERTMGSVFVCTECGYKHIPEYEGNNSEGHYIDPDECFIGKKGFF
jgi:protein-arginine kinase activator protein McsA